MAAAAAAAATAALLTQLAHEPRAEASHRDEQQRRERPVERADVRGQDARHHCGTQQRLGNRRSQAKRADCAQRRRNTPPSSTRSAHTPTRDLAQGVRIRANHSSRCVSTGCAGGGRA
jgi:hypothetical protein